MERRIGKFKASFAAMRGAHGEGFGAGDWNGDGITDIAVGGGGKLVMMTGQCQ